VGLPACLIAFSLASVALGLVRRADVQMLRVLLRRGKPPPAPASPALDPGTMEGPVG
jgi:hypothetical protein